MKFYHRNQASFVVVTGKALRKYVQCPFHRLVVTARVSAKILSSENVIPYLFRIAWFENCTSKHQL